MEDSVPEHTWLFLTLVVNGPSLNDGYSVYVIGGGRKIESDPRYVDATTGLGHLVIGIDNPEEPGQYTGVWVDDLAFWNRKITVNEYLTLYQSMAN